MRFSTRMIAALSAAFAVLVAAQPAVAQSDMMQKVQARFTAADKDHDGKLSKEEAKAGMPRVARYFDQIDADHTGYVTFEQITAFLARQKR